MFLVSCSPTYFSPPTDQELFSTFMTDYDGAKFEKYRFKLMPYHYYKNNRETTSLLSDSTSFIKDNLLFHVAAGEDNISEDRDYFINKSWFELEVSIPKSSEETQLQIGDKVIIKSTAGKTTNGLKLIKVCHIFEGSVGPHIPGSNYKNNIQLIYIDNMKKVIKGKTKDMIIDKRALAFAVEKVKDKIKVYAVIDIGFKRRSDRSVIYDLREIFGSELWMNKINN